MCPQTTICLGITHKHFRKVRVLWTRVIKTEFYAYLSILTQFISNTFHLSDTIQNHASMFQNISIKLIGRNKLVRTLAVPRTPFQTS